MNIHFGAVYAIQGKPEAVSEVAGKVREKADAEGVKLDTMGLASQANRWSAPMADNRPAPVQVVFTEADADWYAGRKEEVLGVSEENQAESTRLRKEDETLTREHAALWLKETKLKEDVTFSDVLPSWALPHTNASRNGRWQV